MLWFLFSSSKQQVHLLCPIPGAALVPGGQWLVTSYLSPILGRCLRLQTASLCSRGTEPQRSQKGNAEEEERESEGPAYMPLKKAKNPMMKIGYAWWVLCVGEGLTTCPTHALFVLWTEHCLYHDMHFLSGLLFRMIGLPAGLIGFLLAKRQVDKNRLKQLKVRQRMRRSNEGDYERSRYRQSVETVKLDQWCRCPLGTKTDSPDLVQTSLGPLEGILHWSRREGTFKESSFACLKELYSMFFCVSSVQWRILCWLHFCKMSMKNAKATNKIIYYIWKAKQFIYKPHHRDHRPSGRSEQFLIDL